MNPIIAATAAASHITPAKPTARVQLPPPWTLLRCFRAFRVFRLFKRIPSLNKIMVSLAKAVPGVINAFVIMAIVMSIYAIIAVEFFAEFGRDGYYNSSITDKDGHIQTVAISAETARGYYYGNEYYGAFDRALYTLWQVLTGEKVFSGINSLPQLTLAVTSGQRSPCSSSVRSSPGRHDCMYLC